MKKIGIVTTTRAEYYLLRPLIRDLRKDDLFETIVYVTGTHLAKQYGETVNQIEKDKIKIDYKVPIDFRGCTPKDISGVMVQIQNSFSEIFSQRSLDLLIILGDRFELMPIVIAASLFGISLAHIHGGEVTEGAYDEYIRHSITKFSHLHFTSCEDHKRRVIQLGESPERVFNVGSLGIQNVKHIVPANKREIEEFLNLNINDNFVLVTLHSETKENQEYQKQMVQSLLNALDQVDIKIIFTQGNADQYGELIDSEICNFVKNNSKKAFYFNTLGEKYYFSLIPYLKGVIGNSSSGIIEVPSFNIPVLNIGNRQKGRICSKAIVHCDSSESQILCGIRKILSDGYRKKVVVYKNPYDGDDVSGKILQTIKSFDKFPTAKSFYDLKVSE